MSSISVNCPPFAVPLAARRPYILLVGLSIFSRGPDPRASFELAFEAPFLAEPFLVAIVSLHLKKSITDC
jgi:hypothetical protein